MSWSFDKKEQKKWDEPQRSEFDSTSSGGFTNQESFQNIGGNVDTPKDESKGPKNNPQQIHLRKTRTIPYEEFIKNKTGAFLYFSKKNETKQYFNTEDVERLNQVINNYSRSATTTYFGTCLFAFAADRALRYKNLIYGMTYRASILKFISKYWFLPTLVTNIAVGLGFAPYYEPKIMNILDKYNLDEEHFRKVYEGDDPNKKGTA